MKCPSCRQLIVVPTTGVGAAEEVDTPTTLASDDDPLGLGDLSADPLLVGNLPQGQDLPSLGPAVTRSRSAPEAEEAEFRREFGDSKIPHRSHVPMLVSVYGVILIVVFSLSGLVVVFMEFDVLRTLLGRSASRDNLISVAMVCGIIGVSGLTWYILVRLSIGLANGYRSSVYGLIALMVIALLVVVVYFTWGNFLIGFLILGISAILLVPPIVGSLGNWSAFQ
jgi:hypothetical protein